MQVSLPIPTSMHIPEYLVYVRHVPAYFWVHTIRVGRLNIIFLAKLIWYLEQRGASTLSKTKALDLHMNFIHTVLTLQLYDYSNEQLNISEKKLFAHRQQLDLLGSSWILARLNEQKSSCLSLLLTLGTGRGSSRQGLQAQFAHLRHAVSIVTSNGQK